MSKASQNREHADRTPVVTFRELPLFLFLLPLFVLMGAHVALLGMLVRKWLRIPYLLAMLLLYGALTIPLWLFTPVGFGPPAAFTALILLCTLCPIAIRGREEIFEGGNLESAFPAHCILCTAYLFLYALVDRSAAIPR